VLASKNAFEQAFSLGGGIFGGGGGCHFWPFSTDSAAYRSGRDHNSWVKPNVAAASSSNFYLIVFWMRPR
jgi:hypothetical protein